MVDENIKKDPEPVVLQPGEVVVDQKTLAAVLAKQTETEKKMADMEARNAGLEAMVAEVQGADTTGGKKLRERKNFEPAFRTVGIKKYPIAGDVENLGYVIGWTNRGAYQKVDKTGVAPVVIDYIDIFFLGHERNEEGKLQAESVTLLSLINAVEVNCKILDTKKVDRKEPTGEEIRVTTFDAKHGLMETGDTIDGWVGFTDITFTLQVPGLTEPVEIDQKFVNV